MRILIKSAKIVCPPSPFHNKVVDILINDGVIVSINANIAVEADEIVSADNLHVSSGWTDCFANFADPGQEQKETIETGSRAAAAGGFTSVCLVPNTNPVVDNRSQLEYVRFKGQQQPVSVYSLGAISKKAEGKELAEIYEMHSGGAVAFTDGLSPVQSPGLLLKALQYVKAFNGLIIQLPDDMSISGKGLMNESLASVKYGMAGKAAIAEELMVARDIELVRYTNSRIHFTGISTAKSVDLIAKAKQDGLDVTCSIASYHLMFTDEDLSGYDSNLKVNPPLRGSSDVQALIKALENGVADCIASHHVPHEWDSKTCEFEYAGTGMITLESVFSLARTAGISTERFVYMQTTVLNNLLGLPPQELAEGTVANLTLFNPDIEYIFSKEHIFSRSANTPLIGRTQKGKALGIVNNGQLFLN